MTASWHVLLCGFVARGQPVLLPCHSVSVTVSWHVLFYGVIVVNKTVSWHVLFYGVIVLACPFHGMYYFTVS